MAAASDRTGVLHSVSPRGPQQGSPSTETWPEYLRRITCGATQIQIAARIGIGRLSVCNWLRGKTRPKAETVIMVARVYQRSPVEALVAAGYLDPDETDVPVEVRTSLRTVSGQDLAAEIARRLS